MSIVDLDNPKTWPQALKRAVEAIAARQDHADYLDEIDLPDSGEEPFRELLSGRSVRAYHATRLLDHEIANIRSRGLLPLTEDLMAKRIEDAIVSEISRNRLARHSLTETR